MKDLKEKLSVILKDYSFLPVAKDTGETIDKIVRLFIDKIVRLFKEPCTCTSDETTGHTTFSNCNVCGRIAMESDYPWNPVEYSIPDTERLVFICAKEPDGRLGCAIGYYKNRSEEKFDYKTGWFFSNDKYMEEQTVTHWMTIPLPNKPKL